MLRGGISDKFGNFYEADWALIETLSVLQGEADEIRLEAFNEDAAGFEFRVTKGSAESWHQCKRRSAGGWTIAGLEREGVLSDFRRKLASGASECVFVSTESVRQLKSECDKARLVEAVDDFYASLSSNEQLNVAELGRVWGDDQTECWNKLRRCRFETVSGQSLKRQANQLCRLLFSIEPADAIARIHAYLSGQLTRRLSTEMLRDAASSMGLGWRAILDPTLDERLSAATSDYLESLLPPVCGEVFSTPDLEAAVAAAFEVSTTGLLIAGGAGSGKSAVLAEIVREGRLRGWPVLALRIDRYLSAPSVEAIGEALTGRAESPAGILGNRHGLEPCLFVVDQVDAVSEASGRSGRIRDELFQMLRDARVYPGVRVVIACRSYDIEHDSRLRALSASESIRSMVLRPLSWDEAVAPVVAKLGVAREFSENEKRILSVPINLRVFGEIVSAGGKVSKSLSGSELFDQLLEIRELELRLAGATWTAVAALGDIARFMSDQQELTAPEQVISAYPNARNLLASMGLIIRGPGRLQFAHESFFDHVFSSTFVSSGSSVCELLLSDQQRLFRRTQVRQIFSRLRDQAAPRAYLRNLREVIEGTQVRYLVKDAIASWLASVPTPTAAEAKIVLELFKAGGNDRTLAKLVLSGPAWLPILLTQPELVQWMNAGEDQRAFALSVLRQGATSCTDQVEGFLRSWWGGSEDRLLQLIEWFQSLYPDGPIGRLEHLFKDLIAHYPADRLKIEGLGRHLDLGVWVHGKQMALAARVLGYWLNKWALSFPDSHPFDRNDDSNKTYWLKELAKADPTAFLQAVLVPLIAAIERERAELQIGQLDWATIQVPFSEHDNLYVRLVVEALSTVSASDPELCGGLLNLIPTEGNVPIYLRLRAIAANGSAFSAKLVELLQRTEIMDIGEHGGEWMAFAEAAHAAMPYLSEPNRGRVEGFVLNYRPEYTRAKRAASDGAAMPSDAQHRKYVLRYLSLTGQTERAVLCTISRALLSDGARRRLDELDRKFPGAPMPRAYGLRGGWVQSPIKRENASRMTDAQWLSAMDKYSGNADHKYFEDHVVGGASQLAGELRERAKIEPARFIALLSAMPPAANAEYAEAILGGIRDSGASHLAADAIRAATKWGPMNVTVNWTVHNHPEAGTSPDILSRVIDNALNGTASDTLVTSMDRSREEAATIADLLRGKEDLSSSGLNSERGSAHDALASVLWNYPETFDLVSTAIERSVQQEPLSSVRMMIFHGINSIGKYDPTRAVALARELGLKDPITLLGHAGRHLLRWAVWRDEFEVESFLEILRGHELPSVRCLAMVLRGALALHDDVRSAKLLDEFDDNTLLRRVVAYLASGNLGAGVACDRAERWLLSLIDDPSPEVRRELWAINWDQILNDDSGRPSLALAFIASRSFEEESDSLMRRVGERVDHFPAIAKAAVGRVLVLMDSWTSGNRNGHWSTLHELGKTLVQLYRAVDGDTEEEERLLDLFDTYLARDPSRVRGELASYERH